MFAVNTVSREGFFRADFLGVQHNSSGAEMGKAKNAKVKAARLAARETSDQVFSQQHASIKEGAAAICSQWSERARYKQSPDSLESPSQQLVGAGGW